MYSVNDIHTNNNNYIEMANLSSKQIVADYVNYRLKKEGFDWANCPPLPPATRVNITMRQIGDEFEQRYREVFHQMCGQLHITPETAYPTFNAIAHELFNDDTRWGRIVALVTFGGAVATQSVEREMPDLVDKIIDWIATYIDVHLHSWIIEHGGWEGFVKFYENGPKEESPWPTINRIAGYAVAGAAILTLGAILRS
ncbi:apoptosis regulator Bcl-2-like [Tubulanus polymorphus]|uniref:apoptosis regulator Bcl-2-like n=1 Tax=Tubulanus polymorphus TaxID=672921 RepID=UPI003DA6BEEA